MKKIFSEWRGKYQTEHSKVKLSLEHTYASAITIL